MSASLWREFDQLDLVNFWHCRDIFHTGNLDRSNVSIILHGSADGICRIGKVGFHHSQAFDGDFSSTFQPVVLVLLQLAVKIISIATIAQDKGNRVSSYAYVAGLTWTLPGSP